MSDSTKLTPEEIQKYREEFKDYPEVLDALDLIEELDGNLIESGNLLVKEAGMDTISLKGEGDNPLSKLAEKYRPVICANSTKKLLDIISILTGAIGLMGVAFALLIYIVREFGLENFCQETD